MPTYRTQVNTGADSLVTSHTLTTPGTVVSGDYAVFWLVRWDSTPTFPAVTAPSGAVLRGTITTGLIETKCYLIKTSGETSFTFSWTGSRWGGCSAQFFTGVDPSLDLTTVPFSSNVGSGTSITTTSVTTVNTAAVSWSVNTNDYGSTTTHGPPTGFTETMDFDAYTAAYILATADGSLSAASATISTSQSWVAGLVALAPAGGGSTPISDSDTSAGTESQSIATSDSDTGSGAESHSLATTSSDSETGAGTDSATIGVSDSDTSTAVDSEAITQGASDSEAPTGTDSQSLAASLSDSETSTGADTESVVASISDSDTATGADTESSVQGANDAETNSGTDTESLAVTLSGTDTNTGADTEAVTANVSDSDTSTGTDTESVSQGGASPSDGDTPTGADTESIAASTSDSETSSGADTESVTASISDSDSSTGTDTESLVPTTLDSDTSGGTETFVLDVQVSDSDVSNVTDSATATQTSTTSPSDSETPSASESWSIVISGAVTPERSLVLGPGSLWIAAYGAVEPTNGSVGVDPDTNVWTDLGSTLGGVELSIENDWIEIELKQLPDRPMKRLKKRRLSIKTQLAEPTLANLAYALNESAPVSGSFEPSSRSEASILSYNALIVDGWRPGFNPGGRHKRRRVIIRKALSVDNVVIQYSKDGQAVYTVTWSCHYVSGTIPPFRVIDEV